MHLATMPKKTTFGKRLRSLRKAAGLNQTQLAEKADLPQQSISDWENDKVEPGWSAIQALAVALDVTPNDFLPGGDPS